MSRVAVCLFFIAILHTGIITSSQANETTTDGVSKNDEAPSKVEAEDKSGVSSKTEPKVEEAGDVTEKKEDEPKEEKEAKPNESKTLLRQQDVTGKTTAGENRKLLTDLLKETPVQQTNVLFEFPKSILGPVNDVGTKIGEAFSKGIDTAKDLAGGTFTFLRTSAKNLFE